ncbi:amidase [Variovorax sp. J31P207]|uniref:amidase n=1 Tax=Variovorax sp. J31P207 TaxID=3053510 RepID=UPI00257899CB|nr:amidase [Variovorax sp. J31P207]MDM0069938.1 amidase [Variovorax sp. J31P207]
MNSRPSHLADWSLCEVVDGTKRGEISAVEVAQATLERIRQRQPILNCFIRVDEEAALRAARESDRKRSRKEALGLLHGVALAHKDMFYRAGSVTTCGSEIRRNFTPDVTATVLTRLDAAGATHVGSLNMVEFAGGPTGHNPHWGNCRNPWHPEHVTGGSSSGSGSAVGGRLVHGSLGSDTGGSIRLPGAFCGVFGLKPTLGRVSRYGSMGLSFSLDTVGPLARTARDCARLMSVLAGPDPMDVTTVPGRADNYEADLECGVKGLRIAVPRNHYFDDVSPEIQQILERALDTYRRLGATIVPVELPHHELISALYLVVVGAEQCVLHDHWIKTMPERYSAAVRARMKNGFAFSAVEYLKALQVRERVASEVARSFDADVLFTPMLRFPVPTIAESDVDSREDEKLSDFIASFTHCTRPISYLGFPALSVPAGFTASGLPAAFQLVGRPLDEKLLLRLGAAYERESAIADRWPALP